MTKKLYNIPGIHESLAADIVSGKITIEEASVEAPPHQRIPVPKRSADAHGLSIPTPPALLTVGRKTQ